MARCGRRQAAGLTGDDWLQWLNEHDSSRFDWEKRGLMLLTAPYMPPDMEVQRKELGQLISAAIRMVNVKDPTDCDTGLLQQLKQLIPGRTGNRHV